MISYWAILRARFVTLLQYRAAAVAGLTTQVFWGFIRIMIFGAFYRSTAGPQPMTYEEIVTYVWLGQGLIMLLPWRPEPEVQQLIRTGNVAYELVRPLSLYRLWFTRSLAVRTAPTLLRMAPLFALALLFFGMKLPASTLGFLAGVAALCLAIYSRGFRRFFTFVIPLACVNYFPATAITGRPDPLHTPAWVPWISPLVGIVFLLACLKAWSLGVRRYHSTGS